MLMTKTRSRLGVGKHTVIFGGVSQQQSSRYGRLVLVWQFYNPEGVVEIVSGTSPVDGTVCGSMLTVVTGVAVGETVDPDLSIGHEFSCSIEQIADGRRTTTITSPSGVSVTTGGGSNDGGNGGFDVG
jgi:hypothetical protein